MLLTLRIESVDLMVAVAAVHYSQLLSLTSKSKSLRRRLGSYKCAASSEAHQRQSLSFKQQLRVFYLGTSVCRES